MKDQRRRDAAALIVPVALLLLTFALRARLLRLGNLGFDGGLAVALAASPLSDLLDLSARDVHPPLFYLALKGWWALAGPGIATALWPSLALGTLAVASAWRLARSIGPRTALATAALLALSPLHVFDGMAARDFAAVVPTSLITTAFFLEWLHGRPRRLGPLAATYTVGLLCSYYVIVTVAAHALVLLWRRRPGLPWVASAAPGVALLIGWAALSLARIGGAVAGGARPTSGDAPGLAAVLSGLLQSTVGGSSLPDATSAAGSWALLTAWAAALTFLPLHRRRADRQASSARPSLGQQLSDQKRGAGGGLDPRLSDRWLLGIVGLELALGATAATVLLWLREVPPGRYALVVLPFAIVLVGLGLGLVLRIRSALAPAFVFFALAPEVAGLYLGWRPPELPASFWDPRGMVAALDREARPGDAAVFISLEQAGYYAALSDRRLAWEVVPVGPRYLEGDLATQSATKVARALGEGDRVRLVLYQGGIAPQHAVLRDALGRAAFPAGERALADSKVVDFVAPRGPAHALGGALRYDGAALEGIGLVGAPKPGTPIGLVLSWRADRPLDRSYSVFVHLVDGRGEKVGQHDGAPADGTRPTDRWSPGEVVLDRHGLLIPSDARGPFSLLIGMYGPDGARLRALDGTDALRLTLPDNP